MKSLKDTISESIDSYNRKYGTAFFRELVSEAEEPAEIQAMLYDICGGLELATKKKSKLKNDPDWSHVLHVLDQVARNMRETLTRNA